MTIRLTRGDGLHKTWAVTIERLQNVSRAIACATFLLFIFGSAGRAGETYTVFDVPGSVGGTYVVDLNANNVVTGYWLDEFSGQHGFVRTKKGKIKRFDVQDADVTAPSSINSTGMIAGYYDDPEGREHGFIRAVDGTIATFDAPGAGDDTTPVAINDKGIIAGFCDDTDGNVHGMVRTTDGVITTFDVPGTPHDSGGLYPRRLFYTSTQPANINNSGDIIGAYLVSCCSWHGFLRLKNGKFTTFYPPGSENTIPTAINSDGTITGYFTDHSGVAHGFIRAVDGSFVTFDVQGLTKAIDINDKGRIAGFYSVSGASNGFMRNPNGKITSFAPPGAQSTVVSAMNIAGAVAGYYDDSSGHTHGFLRSK